MCRSNIYDLTNNEKFWDVIIYPSWLLDLRVHDFICFMLHLRVHDIDVCFLHHSWDLKLIFKAAKSNRKGKNRQKWRTVYISGKSRLCYKAHLRFLEAIILEALFNSQLCFNKTNNKQESITVNRFVKPLIKIYFFSPSPYLIPWNNLFKCKLHHWITVLCIYYALTEQ